METRKPKSPKLTLADYWDAAKVFATGALWGLALAAAGYGISRVGFFIAAF